MPIFTCEGIVLKRRDFGEADRILTILTPFRGKIQVLAKGIRRITSRRGGNVESLNQVKFQVYQGRGISVLSEVESINTFPDLKNKLILSSYATYLVEIVDRLLPEGEVNTGVYRLLIKTLGLLGEFPRKILMLAFEVKLLKEMGFWSVEEIGKGVKMNTFLAELELSSLEEIIKMRPPQSLLIEVERVLRYYIETVLESKIKSWEVIERLKDER